MNIKRLAVVFLLFLFAAPTACDTSKEEKNGDDAKKPITLITFPVRSYPNDIVVTRSNVFVVIGQRHGGPDSLPAPAGTTNFVQVFDLEGNLQADIPVPGGGHSMRITPDGSTLYLASFSWDGIVTAIETTPPYTTTRIGGAGQNAIVNPDAIAISPDGAYVYVGSNLLSGWIARIATANNTIDPGYTVPVRSGYICWLEISADNRTLYAAGWSGGTFQKNDIATGALIAELSVGANPHGLVLTPDEKYVYVMVALGNRVVKINNQSHAIEKEIPGPWAGLWAGPSSGALSGDGNYIFVVNHYFGEVAILDINPQSPTYDQVVATLKAGDDPIFLALSADEDILYVANNGSSNVTMLDVSPFR